MPKPQAQRAVPSAIRREAAFTLIESVVAIGLFAFVIVGIVGLFGSALERQRQASFETRAVILSQQVLSRIRAAQSDTNISFRRGTSGPTTETNFFHITNSTNAANTNVFYYKGTEISGLIRPDNYADSTFSFFPGYPAELDTTTIAGRIRAILTTNGTGSTNLHRVTIEISEPANLPLSNPPDSTNFLRKYRATFTTFATFPD